MTEPIKPALTAEEWELGPRLDEPVTPERDMALANARLPDSDPRKITRRMIAEMEACSDEADSQALYEYAMALASLLPPEGTAPDRELAVDPSVAIPEKPSEVAPLFTNDHAAFLHRLWQHQTDPKILAGLDEIIGLIDALLPSTTSRP